MSDKTPTKEGEWEEILGPDTKVAAESTPSKEGQRRKSRSSMGGGSITRVTAMDNRDPNHLNPQVQVLWDDVIGEPEGLRSPDFCWNASQKCYDGTRRYCYIGLVVLFAPIITFFAACQFACTAFCQVWCAGPCLRLWKINFAVFRKFWHGLLLALCAPCAEVCGLFMSNINVKYQKVPDSTHAPEKDYFNV